MQKRFVGGIALIFCLFGGGISGVGQEVPTPHGEIRVVDVSPLHWISVAHNVFDRLFDLDADGNLVPRLANRWRWLDDHTLEVALRQGVTFHNGEVFDAEAVRVNWQAYTRLQQPHLLGEFLHFKPGSRLEVVDAHTVRFHLPEPDAAALVKLSALHVANRQFHAEHGWGEQQWGILTGAGPWGSGPYRLVNGFSTPQKRADRTILEANGEYWDRLRSPRLQRLVFDNTLSQKEALETLKTGEGVVDLVNGLRPLETLSVTQSSFAMVVKKSGSLVSMFGQFNMRKAGSPWRDVRLRQAVNLAINRAELIRDIKGEGVVIPALLPEGAFGYAADLTPYAFDPDNTRLLLGEAGYPDGLPITLIVPQELQMQAISLSMMLEQAGFMVDLQILDSATWRRKTRWRDVDQLAEQQMWDIALQSALDHLNFPAFLLYHDFAVDGQYDWGIEDPALRRLYERVLRTVDREQQRGLIQQMERHAHEQALFLFLYNPFQLYAANKAVEFVPPVTTLLIFDATSVSEAHWSTRKTASPLAASGPPASRADPTNAEDVALGQKVYASFCAGCHGANLEGQPHWQQRLPLGNLPAPPHDETGHTWHHVDQWLFDIVKNGGQPFAPPRYRSAMPAYKDMLNDDEIWAVLAFIKSHWPPPIRAEQSRLNARGQ